MSDPADIVAALVALLAADPAVNAAASAGAIYGGEIPQAEVKRQPRPALVVKPSGGSSLLGASKVRADTQRIDLFAYGPTLPQAAALANLASRRLRAIDREVHAGVLIHWANSAGGYSDARDPDAGWPRAFRSFQIFYALDVVA